MHRPSTSDSTRPNFAATRSAREPGGRSPSCIGSVDGDTVMRVLLGTYAAAASGGKHADDTEPQITSFMLLNPGATRQFGNALALAMQLGVPF
jgi:hypothetical protein